MVVAASHLSTAVPEATFPEMGRHFPRHSWVLNWVFSNGRPRDTDPFSDWKVSRHTDRQADRRTRTAAIVSRTLEALLPGAALAGGGGGGGARGPSRIIEPQMLSGYGRR